MAKLVGGGWHTTPCKHLAVGGIARLERVGPSFVLVEGVTERPISPTPPHRATWQHWSGTVYDLATLIFASIMPFVTPVR